MPFSSVFGGHLEFLAVKEIPEENFLGTFFW